LQGHVGFSETVVVTEDGCQVLTDKVVARELQILPGDRSDAVPAGAATR
jgi:hypothetical protein